MASNPNPHPIANLDEARLRRLLAQRKADAARLAETDARIADLCRQWSDANGYKVRLTAEQTVRAMEAGR